jgi:hypothetical protein
MPETRHVDPSKLREAPRFLRAPVARGLTGEATGRVQRTGGDFGAGLIRGASLCTRGEALGHGLWLDAEFIQSVHASAADAGDKGFKARFTHPSLSGDGLGSFLGRFKAPRLSDDGQKAIADLHFSQAAHKSPDGDLAEYVMDLADSDPEAFAVSIVFDYDRPAFEEFALEHGAYWDEDDWGPFLNFREFKSPDPDNVKNLPHARLARLRAADTVDEPAANPDGLFHREQAIAVEADAVASYALGLSNAAPATRALSVDPDRVRAFVARFLDQHNLTLAPKEHPMSKPTPTAETVAPDEGQVETADTDTAVEQTATPEAGTDQATEPNVEPAAEATANGADTTAADAGDAAGEPQTAAASADNPRAECKRFIAAFGATNGATWYAEGLSFEDAQAKHVASLTAENADLRKRLAAAGGGEDEPVTFQPPEDKPAVDGRLKTNLGENIARMAAGIKLPGQAAK